MLKKKWKKALAAASLILSLGLIAGCGTDKQDNAQTYKVGIVQLVEHRAVNIANKGFVDGLASRGYKDNVTFDQQNAQADQSNLVPIAQQGRPYLRDINTCCSDDGKCYAGYSDRSDSRHRL